MKEMSNEQERAVRKFPEDSRKTLWEGKMTLAEQVKKKIEEDQESEEKKLDFLVTKKSKKSAL